MKKKNKKEEEEDVKSIGFSLNQLLNETII